MPATKTRSARYVAIRTPPAGALNPEPSEDVAPDEDDEEPIPF